MAYSYRIFDSIEHLDLTEWQRIQASFNASIFTDPRFIAAVEVSMKQVERFWYIVLYDEGGVPIACTSASAMTVDLADFADPGLARFIRHTPLVSSWLRRLKLLIGGLPIGTGHSTSRSRSPRQAHKFSRYWMELSAIWRPRSGPMQSFIRSSEKRI